MQFVLQDCRQGTQGQAVPAFPKREQGNCVTDGENPVLEGLISTSPASEMGFLPTVSLKLNALHICLACDRIGCEVNARGSEVIYHKSPPLWRVKSFIHSLMRLVIQRVRPSW